jgi:predicted AlkP superfamily pyrophosphatase or phosphodiesterase
MTISRRTFGAALAGALAVRPALALPARPKLLVLIVAEQFRSDYFDSHSNVFGSGGFQRLLAGGAYYPNCFLESTTFTASGLATLSTGTYPSVHGIVADRWYDRSLHEVITARPELLEATTFTSQFLASDPRNRVFSVGLNLRNTSILSGGVPYTPKPELAEQTPWTAMGAKSNEALRIIDPARPDFAAVWNASPLAQAAQFAIASKLISEQKLGRGDGLDLLCLVLGSLGLAGLEEGANSPLVFDLVSHLDRQLETLIELLDETLGETSYQIAFTAAHGAADATAAKIAGKDVVAAMPPDCTVEAYVYPALYLRSGSAEAAAVAAAKAGLAAAWYTVGDKCSHTGVWRRRLQNSFHSRRSGDVLLAYAPGTVEDFNGNRGVSYGSIYNYDARVPLILYGPQFKQAEHEESVELIDVAPTLARAMGTGMPSSSTGRVLGEAFAANPSASANR